MDWTSSLTYDIYYPDERECEPKPSTLTVTLSQVAMANHKAGDPPAPNEVLIPLDPHRSSKLDSSPDLVYAVEQLGRGRTFETDGVLHSLGDSLDEARVDVAEASDNHHPPHVVGVVAPA